MRGLKGLLYWFLLLILTLLVIWVGSMFICWCWNWDYVVEQVTDKSAEESRVIALIVFLALTVTWAVGPSTPNRPKKDD